MKRQPGQLLKRPLGAPGGADCIWRPGGWLPLAGGTAMDPVVTAENQNTMFLRLLIFGSHISYNRQQPVDNFRQAVEDFWQAVKKFRQTVVAAGSFLPVTEYAKASVQGGPRSSGYRLTDSTRLLVGLPAEGLGVLQLAEVGLLRAALARARRRGRPGAGAARRAR